MSWRSSGVVFVALPEIKRRQVGNCLSIAGLYSEDAQEQENNQRPYETDLQEVGSWIVTTTETVRLAPWVKQIVVGKVEQPKRQSSPDLVCVEPAQLPLEGILVARGLSRIFTKAAERPRQRDDKPSDVTRRPADQHITQCIRALMVANISHEEIELPKATVLGLAEETSASIVAAINDNEP